MGFGTVDMAIVDFEDGINVYKVDTLIKYGSEYYRVYQLCYRETEMELNVGIHIPLIGGRNITIRAFGSLPIVMNHSII